MCYRLQSPIKKKNTTTTTQNYHSEDHLDRNVIVH